MAALMRTMHCLRRSSLQYMTYPLYSASPSFTPKVSISSLTKLKNHQKNILLHKKTVGPIDQRISQASIHDRKKKRRNYESWIRAGEASKRSEIELWSRAEAKTKLLSYFAFRPFLLCLVGILCLIKYLKENPRQPKKIVAIPKALQPSLLFDYKTLKISSLLSSQNLGPVLAETDANATDEGKKMETEETDAKGKRAILFLFVTKDDPNREELIEKYRNICIEYDDKVNLLPLDPNDDSDMMAFYLCAMMGIEPQDTPTVRLTAGSEYTRYKPQSNKLDEESIRQFLSSYIEGTLQPLSEDLVEGWDSKPVKELIGINFRRVMDEQWKDKNVFLKIYASWCAKCHSLGPVLEELAEKYKHNKDLVIAKINMTKNCVPDLNVEYYPSIQYYKKGRNEVIEYDGKHNKEAYDKFIESGGTVIVKPTEEELREQKENEKKRQEQRMEDYMSRDDVILFISKKHPEYAMISDMVGEAAARAEGDVNFLVVDPEDKEMPLGEVLDIAVEDTPQVRIVHFKEQSMIMYKLQQEVAEENVQTFINDFFANNLEPMSDEPVEGWYQFPVTLLVGKTYEQVVKDASKTVFVFLRRSNCPVCKEIEPIWENLGQKYLENPDTVIAEINVTTNSICTDNCNGFPCFKLFPKGGFQEIVYKGKWEKGNFEIFVDSDGSLGNEEPEEEEEKLEPPK